MRIPVRNSAAFLVTGLLGCAVFAVIKSTHSSPKANEGVIGESGARPGTDKSANGPSGESGSEEPTLKKGEPPRTTKAKERPSESALAKKRLEIRRLEVVKALRKYKKNHPAAIQAMDELKKIEAELESRE